MGAQQDSSEGSSLFGVLVSRRAGTIDSVQVCVRTLPGEPLHLAIEVYED